MKIYFSELTEISGLQHQGLSASSVYRAKYKGNDVVVKAQKKGTLSARDVNDDRFVQEKNILEKNIPGVVKYYGWGDDFIGERFVVIEHLFPLDVKKDNIQQIANVIAVTARQVFLNGLVWTVSEKHVMQDQHGHPKLIDFNDVNTNDSFLSCDKYHDFKGVISVLCDKVQVDSVQIIANAIDVLIEKEYQSLENVHEPIYFEPYDTIPKKITERNDPDYGKCVMANRRCVDRAEMILAGIGTHKGTLLDIGCNLGWFDFFLNDKGFVVTGLDFDKNFWEPNRGSGWPVHDAGKIKFCQMMGELKGVDVKFKNVNVDKEYVEHMPSYDVIVALSILHLYFQQHHVTKDYWIQMFKLICSKVNKVFIFEVSSNILNPLSLHTQEELMKCAKDWGNFSKVYSNGMSDANRPIIICEK